MTSALAMEGVSDLIGTVLKKANLSKGRDAKRPVYGFYLRQRSHQMQMMVNRHIMSFIGRTFRPSESVPARLFRFMNLNEEVLAISKLRRSEGTECET